MRKSALITLFTVFTLLTAMPAMGQVGVFTHRGVGVIAHAQMGDDLLRFGVMPSWVIHPVIELAVGVARYTSTGDAPDFAAYYLTPAVFFYPVRQNESIPVTVYLTGLAHFISVDNAPEGYSTSGWGSGIGVSRKFEGGSMSLTPVVEFLYKGVNTDNGPVADIFNPLYLTVALHFSVDSGAGTLFLGPYYQGYTEEDSHSGKQFGIRAGLTLE